MDTTLVPISEIAAEVGNAEGFVEAWAHRLGVSLEHDWAGRAVVVEPDARKIVAAVAEAGRESAELHEAHQRHLEDWDRRERDAGEQAFQDLIRKALEHQHQKTPPDGYAFYGGWDMMAQPVGPNVYRTAIENAQAAREAFARKNPKVTDLYEFEKRWKKGKIS